MGLFSRDTFPVTSSNEGLFTNPKPSQESNFYSKIESTNYIQSLRNLAQKKNLSKNDRILIDKALAGNANSQVELGKKLLSREIPGNRKQNRAIAFELFQEAKDHFHPTAYAYLGHCYAYGIGCKQDESKARELIITAAKKRDSHGLFLLGYMRLHGDIGFPKSKIKAFELFRLSAQIDNNPDALKFLSYMYEKGWGVRKDKEFAKRLMRDSLVIANGGILKTPHIKKNERMSDSLVIANGENLETCVGSIKQDNSTLSHLDENLKYDISLLLRTFNPVTQRSEFQELSKIYTLKEKAIEGDANAQFDLGCSYYNGGVIDIDYPRAFFWIKKAADQGYPIAIKWLTDHNVQLNEIPPSLSEDVAQAKEGEKVSSLDYSVQPKDETPPALIENIKEVGAQVSSPNNDRNPSSNREVPGLDYFDNEEETQYDDDVPGLDYFDNGEETQDSNRNDQKPPVEKIEPLEKKPEEEVEAPFKNKFPTIDTINDGPSFGGLSL